MRRFRLDTLLLFSFLIFLAEWEGVRTAKVDACVSAGERWLGMLRSRYCKETTEVTPW
jgi:hypothetical protein